MRDGCSQGVFETEKTNYPITHSGFMYCNFLSDSAVFLSSSLGSVLRNQLEQQRCPFPAHSHYITVSRCITVELLQCCLLIADSAGCC